MKSLFDEVSLQSSKLTTQRYSTSFSLGIRFLSNRFQGPIYSIYGFVRYADEIVDTFHDYDQKRLLEKFRRDTYEAIDDGISLNPILNSFQHAVKKYDIDRELIDTFLHSMEMDLNKVAYSQEKYEEYILGSAEVVGLMCLKVFCEGDQELYDSLKYYAMRLGSAFQKINFLRDLTADYKELGRTYFPGVDLNQFNDDAKKAIEADILKDFEDGYTGIMMLPKSARFGVYLAYMYFYRLFNKIQKTPSRNILAARIRIPDNQKLALLLSSYCRHTLNLI